MFVCFVVVVLVAVVVVCLFVVLFLLIRVILFVCFLLLWLACQVIVTVGHSGRSLLLRSLFSPDITLYGINKQGS